MNRRSFLGWGAKIGAALAIAPLASRDEAAQAEMPESVEPDTVHHTWNEGMGYERSALSGAVSGSTRSVSWLRVKRNGQVRWHISIIE